MYQDEAIRATWSASFCRIGNLLDGRRTFYYPDGKIHYEALCENGRKASRPTAVVRREELSWDHRPDGFPASEAEASMRH